MTAFPIASTHLAVVACAILLGGFNRTFCQESPPPDPPPAEGQKNAPPTNVAKACIEPAPLPGISDYNGPLKKTVGIFARALERKSVHQPHYKAGVTLCTLELSDKFLLFVDESIDPVNFLQAGFDSAIDQATNRDPTFGQGAAGYGKRFAAQLADSGTSRFFKDFVYPSIFFEDPRYYRLGHGTVKARLLHAASHVFVAHHENGTPMFNYSEWLGSFTAAELSNLYHPGNEHGVGDTAVRVASGVAFDIGYDMLREFLPEITRKFMIPSRGEAVQPGSRTGRQGN